ncbi:MAG: ZIP family metal transporter [Patescibacteria group bacterium]|nr:MAG: ZIP family metal transporter [Patescibacteria group bacterium]
MLIQAITASFLVSLVSLIGILFIVWKLDKQKKLQFYLISFSAGSFLGVVFFDLLPEALESVEHPEEVFTATLSGLLLFFLIEKFIHWRHCHLVNEQQHKHHLAYLNIIGDILHNFLDGLAIAVAFFSNIKLGITTTFSIIMHEIPQELSDFNILLFSGLSKRKAIAYNFITALTSLLGTVFGFWFLNMFNHYLPVLTSLTAGGFLYIATSDLIPELHKSNNLKEAITQILLLATGLFVIMYLSNYVHNH